MMVGRGHIGKDINIIPDLKGSPNILMRVFSTLFPLISRYSYYDWSVSDLSVRIGQ